MHTERSGRERDGCIEARKAVESRKLSHRTWSFGFIFGASVSVVQMSNRQACVPRAVEWSAGWPCLVAERGP